MSIEISPASIEAKPAAASDTGSASGKPTNASKAGDSPSGGFMAILAAVEAPAAAAPASTLAEDALITVPSDALPTALVVPQDLLGTGAATDIPLDAAAFFAQSQQWAPTEPIAGEVGGVRLALVRPTNAPIAGVSVQEMATDPSDVLVSKPTKGKSTTATSQSDFGAALGASSESAVPKQADSRTPQLAQKFDGLQTQASVVGAAAAPAALPLGREDVLREHSIFKPLHVEVGASPQPVAVNSPATTVVTPAGVPAPAEVYVAEQVKYWISNDVKNAEMKLDGIGKDPVEVSISMHGNEAHVAFRTDEIQAREVLENASLHLKDLLQREGLVLSGVSVGTAGAGEGDAGAQERKPRQGGRSAVVTTVQSTPANRGPVSGMVSGRALDLFV